MPKGFNISLRRQPGEMDTSAHSRVVNQIAHAEADLAAKRCPNLCGPLSDDGCLKCGFVIQRAVTVDPRPRGAGFNRRWVPKVHRRSLADRFYNAALELDRQGQEEMATAYLEVTMQLMIEAVKVERSQNVA